LSLPVVVGTMGIALDYTRMFAERTRLQAMADSAAITAAHEFQIANADEGQITAVADAYLKANAADATATTEVNMETRSIAVELAEGFSPTLSVVLGITPTTLTVRAVAHQTGGEPICLIGLDTKRPGTVSLEKAAELTAPGCAVYSDSTSQNGLRSKDDAVLHAGLICSAGGVQQDKGSNVTPGAISDCPQVADPLASRAPPSVGSCTASNTVISGTTTTLAPGVYCGGLKITHDAAVTLAPGVYVIEDGPLVVDQGGSMTGEGVGFYLVGKNSNITFAKDSTISLIAPKDGPMAGLLIFDDPTGAAAPADPPAPPPPPGPGGATPPSPPPREHKILSNNAHTLLGTIYMPHGRLIVDADNAIADDSAYTVLVVQQLDLYDGPNLVLNSDYGASDVPVPAGVGPKGGATILTK
jgi:Flp pilus assembly protein TadG